MKTTLMLPVVLLLLGVGGSASAQQVDPECSDGLDNDGDGLVDYPADPDCVSSESTFEGFRRDGGVNMDQGVGPNVDAGGGGTVDAGTDLSPACPCAGQDLGMFVPGQGGGGAEGTTLTPVGGGTSPANSGGCQVGPGGLGATAYPVIAFGMLLFLGGRRPRRRP